ncbi:hypothetical protein P175DRAFT_0535719 [Aspergillus ochraceoroseus IBT 24754]|uniref:Aminoglycoside phosphotransferase domain-containing protein n=1 Tax=Aspergillus ochraceoroseus IBT 24754 TaxID=1392256 RepID=A0A2T5LM80_9EURO|nr:uncharacterized protein P175DRAFT_0535719 [Aspergillus ochraceoroseus IBT 24754]PTU17391.1 hypothetical protein P175DRAFT_0535719 [Aspergillus ochraceoroseus IBT 24754]
MASRQYVPGVTLGSLWPSLSEHHKSAVLAQLQLIFTDMRSLPSPVFYSSIIQGPVPHQYFLSRDGNPAITGPFLKGEDLSKAIALRPRHKWDYRGKHGWTSDFLTRHLPLALSGHPPTFTHRDLYRENILISKVSNPNSGVKEYTIAAIIDWETAGCVEEIIDPWPLEGTLFRFVFDNLEF